MSEATDTDASVLIDLTDASTEAAVMWPVEPADIYHLAHQPPTARGRRSARRLVSNESCRLGRPTFLGPDAVVPGGRLLAVIDADATAQYLALVSTLAQSFD